MSQTPPSAGETAAVEPGKLLLRIKRQDGPGKPARWEEFSVPHSADRTVISCLQWIAAHPSQSDGTETTPPAWEASCRDESCGACTMLINGKVRLACSTVAAKVGEADAPITLEPLSKFPVVRDLWVDRSRLFNDLSRVKAWIPIDGSYDLGPGFPLRQSEQRRRYPLSQCINCGCCLEACPQYTAVNQFVGAAAINAARLANEHPVGGELRAERLDALMQEGGVGDCAKSGNCTEVCPVHIPLMESIAVISRQVTGRAISKLFGA